MPKEAPHHRPPMNDDEMVQARPRIIPRTKPTPIPEPSIFDEPTYCLKVNKAWAAHFLGVIVGGLDQPDTWIPNEVHDVEWARLQIREWVAKFLTEDMCMPCCDDLVEQLTELITINNNMLTNITTIVTNLTTVINNQVTLIDNSQTIIDNGDTVINQNDQELITTATNIYNNQVLNNQNISNTNQMFYDGTPQSISPELGDNFNSTGGNAALCGAIKSYIDKMVTDYTTRVDLAAFAFGVAVGAATTFFTIVTGGAALPLQAVAMGFLSSTAVGVSAALWHAIINDQAARRKVYCCMFDSLKDQPITQDAFKNAVQDCGFDPTTFEGHIAGLIQNESGSDSNYLAFLRALGQNQGNAQDCMCDCDDEIVLEDFGGTGTIITPMGNCLYRFYQPNPASHYLAFRDILGQCLHVENSDDPAHPSVGVGQDTTVVDCNDVESNFIGGFAGSDLKSVRYAGGGDARTDYYKVTLAE